MEDHDIKRDQWWESQQRAAIASKWLGRIGWLLAGFMLGLLF